MNPTHHPSNRKGFVLLAVMVFILLLSMITLSLMFQSQGNEAAGHALNGSEQAWSAAMSGVEETIRVAATAPAGSTDWQDDPATFRAREVYQDGVDAWYFTVFSPADSDSLVDIRYGLSDEASRLNLNHPGEADLSKVPGLSSTLASTIRQFIGLGPPPAVAPEPTPLDDSLPPSEPAPTNAPESISISQSPPHGPLSTLEELLLAPGLSRAMLHGVLANSEANLSLVPLGGDLPSTNPAPSTKPRRIRGLDQYFTVFSRDPNRTAAGHPRFNLNAANDPLPRVDLPDAFTNYLAAARAAKIQMAHPCEALEAVIKAKNSQGVEEEIASGITKENLAVLLDAFAADNAPSHEGLVNVNTASTAVLATLPGIDLPLAETIVSTRTGMSAERRTTVAWLYQEGVVDAAKFKRIAPGLTARSSQFRFSVIGYGLPSGRYRVLEVVIDLSEPAPRILYLRDITRLGLPIPLKGSSEEIGFDV